MTLKWLSIRSKDELLLKFLLTKLVLEEVLMSLALFFSTVKLRSKFWQGCLMYQASLSFISQLLDLIFIFDGVSLQTSHKVFFHNN